MFACLCRLLYPHSFPTPQPSLSQRFTPVVFLHFTSFFPALSVTPLFRSLRKSHSLIWDMLDLVSLKATLLTPCLPLLRIVQAIFNSFTIRQTLSAGMTLIGKLLIQDHLLMLILYLLPDLLVFPLSSPFSFSSLYVSFRLLHTYWVSVVT